MSTRTRLALLLPVLLLCSLAFTSCATPLETLVEEQHQQRIDDSMVNQPIIHGGSDGMGTYIADTASHMTLQSSDSTKTINP